ncbi:hypothetical protein J6590_004292 [Homalodisca vitripennis]|nr:hypothetical protein J6590_004292 [Homalodisca vitripennis]
MARLCAEIGQFDERSASTGDGYGIPRADLHSKTQRIERRGAIPTYDLPNLRKRNMKSFGSGNWRRVKEYFRFTFSYKVISPVTKTLEESKAKATTKTVSG